MMIRLDCVDAVSVTSADVRDLTRLTQEVEVSTGLVDMTFVRLAKLFEPQPSRRGCVLYESGSPVGWVAVRVDGCTGVLTAEQSVFASESAALRSAVAGELVETAGRMAVEIGATSGVAGTPETLRLRFEVPRADAVMREALASRGARVVHHWKRLRADINEVLRGFPEQAANVEVRRVETEDDFAAHHRIRNIGYGQLPEDRILTLEEWHAQLCDEPGSAPESWLLAYLNGEPVGMLAASLSRAELGAWYGAHSATLPEARGAHINHALNRTALNWGLAQGLTWIRSRSMGWQKRDYSLIDYLDIWETLPRP
jgi:hypothetical protein